MTHEPDDVFTEFYIDGTWTDTYDGEDLSARVRGGDSIRIQRGGSDQFSSITTQSMNFTLNNRDNLFTDDDPNSPLFRKFGQNTRVRAGVLDPTRGLDLYARFSNLDISPDGERIWTADKASLDITGDLDIRWEMDIRGTRNYPQMIAAKYLTSGNQRSWAVYTLQHGGLALRTSADGATNILHSSTAAIVPENEGRLAYRVTLDVNNGAGGKTYTWYTAPSLAGPWTLAETTTVAGTTSIFSSSAELLVGAGNGGYQLFTDTYHFTGRMYGFELRNGIAGTLVANFDPNTHAEIGDTSWADTCASPNTWTIANSTNRSAIRLGSDRIRFTGEIQTRPDDWDESGTDRWCAMTAQGILSHYSSNRAPLQSVERRYWTRQSDIVGYWPMEDGDGATTVSSAIDEGFAGEIVDCSFGEAEGFFGTSGAMTLDEAGVSTASFVANEHTGSGAWGWVFYFKLEELPVSEAVLVNIYPIFGSVQRWAFQVGLTTFRWTAYSPSGAVVADSFASAVVNPSTGWVAMSMTYKQEGGNIRYETSWHAVGGGVSYTHAVGGTTFAGTVGQATRAYFSPTDSSYDRAQIAQFVFFNKEYEINSNEFADISVGFAGETFIERWIRLLAEENIPHDWIGDPSESELVGPQLATTLYSILEAGAKVDAGLISEARDTIGLSYISGRMLGNRKRLDLSYTSSHLSNTPRPADSGRYTVNDFTAKREDGGSARYQATDARRKNIRLPDDPVSPGVGPFERSESYNAFADSRMPFLASFRVHLGTWDERIIPTMIVSTHRTEIGGDSDLLASIFSQDIGDPIAIVDTAGTPMPPNDARALTTGYTETIKNLTHDISFNTVPIGPYDVGVFSSYDAEYVPVLDVEGEETTLDGALNTTATTIPFKTLRTALVPFWVDSVGYPADIGGGVTLDIDINGERVRVTSITAPTSDATYNYQIVTATRSVNSVVKSHLSGTVIRLFEPTYLGKI